MSYYNHLLQLNIYGTLLTSHQGPGILTTVSWARRYLTPRTA